MASRDLGKLADTASAKENDTTTKKLVSGGMETPTGSVHAQTTTPSMDGLKELKGLIVQKRTELDRRIGRFELLQSQLEETEARISQLTIDLDTHEKALLILQDLAERLRIDCQRKIESLVTGGLQVVFERPYQFVIESSVQRNLVAMRFLLRTPLRNKEYFESEIYDSFGGGIIDVISFLLRVIVLVLIKPRPSGLLLLDEVFPHVSRAHLENVGVLLRKLTDNLGLQILLVTHSPEIAPSADVVYTVTKQENNVRIVREEN